MQQKSLKLKHALLAAALCTAAAAPAMAQVTVMGLVDTYAGSMRNAGDANSRASVNSGGLTTSWIGFKGTEDLGGGLKANFLLTSFFQADTGVQGRFPGDTMWSRDAVVGLSGGFGSISFGRELAPHFLPTILFNPFGDSYTFSPLNLHNDVPLFNASGWSNSVAGDTGWSNSIRYTTPDFGGLKANLHYQLGEQAGKTGVNNIGANALYFNGPLALTAYYNTVEVNNPLNTAGSSVGFGASRQKAWMFGGSYDLKAAKLFATYGQTSHNVDLDDKTLSLGATVPMGAGKIMAAWAQTKREGTVIGADQTRKTASVGYDYDMSKRTDLYAVYMNDRITGTNNGNSFGVGIRHRF
ncbi:porin [Noviherbaspirillum denitrificans]|uniref:Porin n=1 Tax=Noviherbaspirillum denitrificans TaxID=1968433 RepID=A0A254TE36_9BURK|nr:porin [Noviherbaspirillum denitrificans]OWW20910.1 porin [Noviherbaspirillum denitrificans]